MTERPLATPANEADGPFLIDPKQRPFAVGEAARPHRPIAWGQALVLMAFMTPFLWASCSQLGTLTRMITIRVQLAEDGRPGQATVLERREIPHEEGKPSYALRFSFAPPGRPAAEFDRGVSQDTYDATTVGGGLPVVYSPSHPEAVLPTANHTWGPVGSKALFALLWNAICLPMVGWLGYQLWFDLRIQRASRLLRGRLVAIAEDKDAEGDVVVKVDYAFEDPDGQPVTATWSGPCKALEGRPLPPAGTPIAVAYAGRRTYVLL